MNRSRSRLSFVLTAVGAAVLLAGCGGSNKPPAASGNGGGQQNGISAAYRFSRCMRQHGVYDFPDPKVRSSAGHVEVGIKVTPGLTSSPQFKNAQQACGGLLGGPNQVNDGRTPAQQQARVRGFISFANCMRSHQVPTFPDPTAQGEITPQMLAAANIDVKAPAVRAAAIGCVPSSEGQLTKAQVERALGPA